MKSWSKSIQFAHPLRGVSPVRPGQAAAPAVAPQAQPSQPQPEPVDWEEKIKAAFEAGRIEGEKALGEQLLRQRAEVRTALDGVVKSLHATADQVIADTEKHLVALVLEIARKLVADMPISGQMIEAVVRDALLEVEGTADFHVRLHPADLALLESMQSPLLEPADEAKTVRFHAAPEVTRGGCLIQTRFGVVDARRETKMELLKRSLTP